LTSRSRNRLLHNSRIVFDRMRNGAGWLSVGAERRRDAGWLRPSAFTHWLEAVVKKEPTIDERAGTTWRNSLSEQERGEALVEIGGYVDPERRRRMGLPQEIWKAGGSDDE
jgi:hypothetical protein